MNFVCKSCDYNTSNKKDYNKHLHTAKHINRTQLNEKSPNQLYTAAIFVINNSMRETHYGITKRNVIPSFHTIRKRLKFQLKQNEIAR